VGDRLLARTSRGVQLTPDGEQLLRDARRVLALADESLVNARKVAEGISGSVSVGFTSVVGQTHLPQLLTYARDQHPDIDLHLHEMVTSDQLQGLESGLIDLAMGRPLRDDNEHAYRALPPDRLVVAVPEDWQLASVAAPRVRDLHRRDLVMYNEHGARYFHDHLVRIFSAFGVQPTYVQKVTQVATMVALVRAGLGAAVIPASAHAGDRDGIAILDLPELDTYPVVARLMWRSDSDNPALHRFISALPEF
jgi:DNA-binding transcriptional LysR family regulator